MLRYIYAKGASSLRELSRSIKLSFPLLHTLFQRLRQQQVFEITGMDGNDYTFTLSGIGREQVAKRHLTCHYIGPAPVSVFAYTAAVRNQNIRLAINHALLKTALADLVLTDRFMDELGPALVSQKSIFLYGPTGNGKTSVVSRLSRLHQDTIVIPYAIEVDGQVIGGYRRTLSPFNLYIGKICRANHESTPPGALHHVEDHRMRSGRVLNNEHLPSSWRCRGGSTR
jgi:hypothetical protein